MKKIIAIVFTAVGVLTGFVGSAAAQTSYTVTNVVTVLVTNFVTVTNVVVASPILPEPTPTAPVTLEMAAKYPWVSSLSAGLTLTRGNSHTLLYSGGIETAKKTPNNEYVLGASGAYGSQDSKDNVNNYKGFTQWNHLFTERFSCIC